MAGHIEVTEIKRIRLNRQGYDSGGEYYGTGEPVFEFAYYVESNDPSVEPKERYSAVRAPDRAEAKKRIRKQLEDRYLRSTVVFSTK